MSNVSIFLTRKRGRPAKTNDLNLTLGEVLDLRADARKFPSTYIHDLLKKRFTKREFAKRFSTDASMAQACKDLIESSFPELDRDAHVKQWLSQLQSTQNQNAESVFLLFRDAVRGYSDKDIAIKEQCSRKECRLRLARVNQSVRMARQRMTIERRKGSLLAKRYAEKIRELNALKTQIASIDPSTNALLDLTNQTFTRREPSIDMSRLFPGDVHTAWRIALLNPALVDFPLRFMIHLPVLTYRTLVKDWERSPDKIALMDKLAPEVLQGSMFDELDGRLGALGAMADPSRQTIFKELRVVALAGYYQSTALIATTQIEGLLWDYAKHLNANGKPIFKLLPIKGRDQYSVYLWDRNAKDYRRYANGKMKTPTDKKRGKKVPCPSGRRLLQDSRLQEFITAEIYHFLLDEFFDQRNSLAHGNLSVTRPMVVQTILCLLSVLHDMQKGT